MDAGNIPPGLPRIYFHGVHISHWSTPVKMLGYVHWHSALIFSGETLSMFQPNIKWFQLKPFRSCNKAFEQILHPFNIKIPLNIGYCFCPQKHHYAIHKISYLKKTAQMDSNLEPYPQFIHCVIEANAWEPKIFKKPFNNRRNSISNTISGFVISHVLPFMTKPFIVNAKKT